MKKITFAIAILVSLMFSLTGFSQKVWYSKNQIMIGDTLPIDLFHLQIDYNDLNQNQKKDTLFTIKWYNGISYGNNGDYHYYCIVDSSTSTTVTLTHYIKTYGRYTCDYQKYNYNTNTWDNIPLTYIVTQLFKFTETINTNSTDTTYWVNVYGVYFKYGLRFINPATVGFEDNFDNHKQEAKVYPNPCENTLNTNVDGLKRLFDVSGRLVKESYEKALNVSDLTPGVYILEAEGVRTKIYKK